MPNWVENEIKITGPTKDLWEFLDSVDKEEGIIRTFLPCPKELMALTSPVSVVDTEEEARELNLKNLGFENKIRYISKRKSDELISKYEVNEWYEWQHQNWGIKWGDCETCLEMIDGKIIGSFNTPWGPPVLALTKISKFFPLLTFEINYFEGGMGFQGIFIVSNGIVKKDISCDYSGHRGG